MSRPTSATVPAFVAHRFALLRLLWASWIWGALARLAFDRVLSFQTVTRTPYHKALVSGFQTVFP